MPACAKAYDELIAVWDFKIDARDREIVVTLPGTS
jgi:hypothetical protein